MLNKKKIHWNEAYTRYFRKRVCGVLKLLSYQVRLQYGRCVLRGCMPKDMERKMNKQNNSHLFEQFVIIENKLQTFACINVGNFPSLLNYHKNSMIERALLFYCDGFCTRWQMLVPVYRFDRDAASPIRCGLLTHFSEDIY